MNVLTTRMFFDFKYCSRRLICVDLPTPTGPMKVMMQALELDKSVTSKQVIVKNILDFNWQGKVFLVYA